MSRSRAMRSACSAIAHEPALYLAEFVSRWVLWTMVMLLVGYGVIAYARSLPVSDLDLLGLSGRLPGTAAKAMAHIFAGSGPTLVRILLAVAIGVAFLWWVVASISRSVTLACLAEEARLARPPFAAVGGANALRLGVWLLVIAAALGAYVFAAHRAQLPDARTDRKLFVLLAFSLWAVTMGAGRLLDWLLTLAPIVRLRDAQATFISAVQVAFENTAQFLWVHVVLGVVRFFMFWAGAIAFFVLLSVAMESPPGAGLVIIGIFGVFMAAASSLLQVLRVAAYARIVKWDDEVARLD